MANRRLIIQKKPALTSVNDSSRTLYLVRLSYLINKCVHENVMRDRLSFGASSDNLFMSQNSDRLAIGAGRDDLLMASNKDRLELKNAIC